MNTVLNNVVFRAVKVENQENDYGYMYSSNSDLKLSTELRVLGNKSYNRYWYGSVYFELPGKTFVAYNKAFQLSFPGLW